MSFLLLSATQVIILAGLTVAAVLILFFLKLRHRRLVVGSSLLWNRVLDEQHANSLLEKLRRLASLALTLTIALLIALAIGRPQVDSSDSGAQSVVLVLDTSPSMLARTGEGGTRWSRASERALELVSTGAPAVGYMVADTAGRVRSQMSSRRQTVANALDAMRPFPGAQQFPNLPTSGADVYFITDGVTPLDIPAGVTEISVFEPTDNVAITAFQVRVDPTSPSGYRAFLEVTNYSTEMKNVPVLLSGSGDQREAWRVELNGGEIWQDDVDLSGFRGGGIRLRIEAENDGLELDDTAYAYLPGENSVRVDLVTANNDSYLATLLELSPRVDLRIVDPEDFEDDPTVGTFVFDGFVPETAPASPTIVFGAADVGWLPPSGGTATDQTITSWDKDHAVMLNVPVYDVAISETALVEAANWTVVAGGEETPLIVVDEGTIRRVLVGFPLENSDFAFHLGFPIFVENALAWTSGEALAEEVSLGQVMIPLEAESVTMLDGTSVPTRLQFGQTVIEAREPDLYTATLEGRRHRVAANLLDRSASNINQTRLTGDLARGPIERRGNELWVYMLVAASVLATLEWWTYHRRITL